MKHKHLFILWTGSEFRPLFALAHAAFNRCHLSLALFLYPSSARINAFKLLWCTWCCMFKGGAALLSTYYIFHVYYWWARKKGITGMGKKKFVRAPVIHTHTKKSLSFSFCIVQLAASHSKRSKFKIYANCSRIF